MTTILQSIKSVTTTLHLDAESRRRDEEWIAKWGKPKPARLGVVATIRNLPMLLQLDRQARREGIAWADRRADWWGNLAALKTARTGAWK